MTLIDSNNQPTLDVADLKSLLPKPSIFNLDRSLVENAVLTLKGSIVRPEDGKEEGDEETRSSADVLKATTYIYENSITNKMIRIPVMSMLFTETAQTGTIPEATKAYKKARTAHKPLKTLMDLFTEEASPAGAKLPVPMTINVIAVEDRYYPFTAAEKAVNDARDWKKTPAPIEGTKRYSPFYYKSFVDTVELLNRDGKSIMEAYNNEDLMKKLQTEKLISKFEESEPTKRLVFHVLPIA